jgi:hypothetical protein
MMRMCKQISFAVFCFLCIGLGNAPALTFETYFIGGAAPDNAVGGGNLDDIVNAAARIWESAYADPIIITLYYGWAPIGDAGNHTLLAQGDNPNREITGRILFDNSGTSLFYLDPTPDFNEEYRRLTEEYEDLGAGLINVGRIYRSPLEEAAGSIDLLSVALHEMGHALGMSSANYSFIDQSRDGILYISGGLPFNGTMIPLAYNNSGIIPHFDANEIAYGSVMSGINSDERRMPSELDIVANAQISGYTVLNLDLQEAIESGQPGTAVGIEFRRNGNFQGIYGLDWPASANPIPLQLIRKPDPAKR